MPFFLVLLAGFLLVQSPIPQVQSVKVPDPPCSFSLMSREASPFTVEGPDDMVSRVSVIGQPDSPIEILGADFTNYQVTFGNSAYVIHRGSFFTVDVRNRSDREVVGATVMVGFQLVAGHPGGGHGDGLKGPLGPGETARITLRASGGSGSGPWSESRPVTMMLRMQEVKFADCNYVPSRSYALGPR